MIEVGKVFVDGTGAGRLYIPRTVVQELELLNKDPIKLEVADKTLFIIALKHV